MSPARPLVSVAIGALLLGCLPMSLPPIGASEICSPSLVRAFHEDAHAAERSDLWIVFVDVGHGDATWIRTPGLRGVTARDILVDAGDDGRPHAPHVPDGGAAVREVLDRGGLAPGAPIDVLVLTHPDKDHYGGVVELIEHHPAAVVIESGRSSARRTWVELQRRLAAVPGVVRRRPARLAGIDPNEAGLRVSRRWGRGVTVSLLSADADGVDDNGASVVIAIGFAGRTILLMADAGEDVEARRLGQWPAADVLRVGHHAGAGTSTSAFLDQVLPDDRPRHAVISAGERPGLPDPDVVERLAARVGHRLWRTDRFDGDRSRRDAAGDDHILLRVRADDGQLDVCYLDADPRR